MCVYVNVRVWGLVIGLVYVICNITNGVNTISKTFCQFSIRLTSIWNAWLFCAVCAIKEKKIIIFRWVVFFLVWNSRSRFYSHSALNDFIEIHNKRYKVSNTNPIPKAAAAAAAVWRSHWIYVYLVNRARTESCGFPFSFLCIRNWCFGLDVKLSFFRIHSTIRSTTEILMRKIN